MAIMIRCTDRQESEGDIYRRQKAYKGCASATTEIQLILDLYYGVRRICEVSQSFRTIVRVAKICISISSS